MDDPLEFVPGFISPLTDKQHAQIGRIALLWGQIEWHVESLLPRVSGLTWDQLKALAVTEKPIGTKVEFLSASGRRHHDQAVAKAVADICDAINDTKVSRNHVFHGIWGWRTDDRTKAVEPAARKTATPHAPFKASQLAALEKRLCRCSRLGAELVCELDGEETRVKYSRYFHGKSAFPQWLVQWTERNPVDHDALDRIAKAGQLPRLETPYPRT